MPEDSSRARSRREFIATTGAATAAAVLPGSALAQSGPRKRRYALIGAGHRGSGMWGRSVAERYSDIVDFVGLCDTNPLRVEACKKMIGVSCPTYGKLDEMISAAKPEALIVTTVDATHSGFIVSALERGLDVITEKPMVTDETQCRAVLDAEKRTGKKLVVTFNYRYAPKHQKIKELLLAGEIGTVTSVDFSWYLDIRHGADYFRRWHRLRDRSGSLWVHKASHHFDLVNWWLGAEPVEVEAFASLQHYGKKGPFRSTTCRGCPHKSECQFYWDIAKDPRLVKLYVECESADGYVRDGCVFKEDVDIPDTMNAVVRYTSGATMSYSLNTFMPFEGYRLAFNGTKGRLEVRDFERQPWQAPEETEIHVTKNFGQRTKIEMPKAEGGHGGGDERLKDLIFRGVAVPEYMKLPDARAGAMSCLTGIAARKSADEGRAVKIADLLKA